MASAEQDYFKIKRKHNYLHNFYDLLPYVCLLKSS